MSRATGRVLAVAAVVAGLWFALRGVDLAELLHALARVHLLAVAGASLPLLALGSLVRTARYAALLPEEGKADRFPALWSAVMLSAAANNVLPLRAGELVRTRETVALGFPLSRVAFAQVTEKLVEAATLVVCSVPVLLAYVSRGRVSLVVAGVAALVAIVVTAALRYDRRDLLRALVSSAGWSFAADAVELAIVAVCLHGLGLPYGLAPSIAVYAAVNLALAVPSTPGNVGAFEAGAALPLLALGAPRDAAIAFACVYRVVQWVPVNVVGLALWLRRLRLGPAREPS